MENGASSYLRFLNGDNDAFVGLVREYNDKLVLFLNTVVGDIHMAEEAADETFLKLYTNRPAYNEQYSFKTWLYTIAKNTALNYVKKLKRGSVVPIEDCVYLSDETDIEEEYIKGEQNTILHHAIKALNSEYSQVLYLIYFEGMSNAEAAKVMGKTSRQLYNLLYRAKQALREELERRDSNGQV